MILLVLIGISYYILFFIMGAKQSINTNATQANATQANATQANATQVNANKYTDFNLNDYKKIHIQKLNKVDKKRYSNKKNYVTSVTRATCPKNSYHTRCTCNMLYTESNGPTETCLSSNGFFGAFCSAYNYHGDVMISPDDVWIVIMIFFKEYVNDNAEALRTKFVSHEGKKTLTVITRNELSESKWDEFFTLMIDEIKKNTKDNIVDKLKSDFTTSGRFEQIISTSAIMDTFKSYFEYDRIIPACGIQNIWMKGTVNDWIKLKTKLASLRKYDINNIIIQYINKVSYVLDKFIDTYQNNVDVRFWQHIMDITEGQLGSGTTHYTSGWILYFFGIYNEIEGRPDLKDITVDIKIDNNITGETKKVKLVAGFTGVNEIQELVFAPQMAITIIEPIC